MPRKQTIFYDLKGTADASGNCTIRSNRLRGGQLLCVQVVSTRNDDNDNVKARVGIDRMGAFYEIVTILCTSKTLTYAAGLEIWLESDCQLRIDITGANPSGPCYAWLYGYLTDTD